MIRNFVSVIAGHWLSLVGAILALVGLAMIIVLIGLQLAGFQGGPYLGIVTFILMPMVFALGLALMPIGAWRRRKLDAAARERNEPPPRLPIIDLNNDRTRGTVLVSVFVGLLSLVVLAGATYKGVHVMETVAFCGTVCHVVMEPQHTAFQRSSHSKLTCADCHIGSGADWFVKSKISGSWQLVSVAFDLHPRPIPNPVHNLRPARDTCEQCHWPTRHVGDTLRVRTKFAEDEANTPNQTVLLMKVGGQQGGKSSGIHWHVDRGVQIRFQSDPSRQIVYDVEMKTADGKTRTFKTEQKPTGPTEWRTMDCVDCHNRPSHTFKPAALEVDNALEDGRIDKTLPFIKRESMRVLNGKYATKEEAQAGIAREVEAFYKASFADLASTKATTIAAAGKALGDIYSWNVFPRMNVTWGTYKNNLGHADDDNPGCMRCHDKKHVAEDGSRISGGCKSCHAVLADEEENPEILKTLKP